MLDCVHLYSTTYFSGVLMFLKVLHVSWWKCSWRTIASLASFVWPFLWKFTSMRPVCKPLTADACVFLAKIFLQKWQLNCTSVQHSSWTASDLGTQNKLLYASPSLWTQNMWRRNIPESKASRTGARDREWRWKERENKTCSGARKTV